MSPSWLTLFIASVHVLLQAGIVRGKQLEILTWNEVNYVSWVCFCPFQGCNWGGFVPHSWDKVEWNSIPPWLGCSGRATIHTAQGGWAPAKRSKGGLAFKWTSWLSLEAAHLTQGHALLNVVHMEPLWWEEVLTVLSLTLLGPGGGKGGYCHIFANNCANTHTSVLKKL